jgi:Flp pilus assembly pilin Flp
MATGIRFLSDESGAVTIDWVVLTAGIVFIALTFMAPITSAVGTMAQFIAGQIGLYSGYLQ